MSQEKFAYAGVSTQDGTCKVRFANDQMRIKVLAKNGHKDIDIILLKEPMTKVDAVKSLIKANFAQGNATVQAALDAALEKREPVAVEKKVVAPKKTPAKAPAKAKPATPKATVVTAVASTKESIEDKPF